MPHAHHVRRAILNRQFRRGYKRAADELIAAASGRLSATTFSRLCEWRRRIAAWDERLSANALVIGANSPPPFQRF